MKSEEKIRRPHLKDRYKMRALMSRHVPFIWRQNDRHVSPIQYSNVKSRDDNRHIKPPDKLQSPVVQFCYCKFKYNQMLRSAWGVSTLARCWSEGFGSRRTKQLTRTRRTSRLTWQEQRRPATYIQSFKHFLIPSFLWALLTCQFLQVIFCLKIEHPPPPSRSRSIQY